LGKFLEKIAIVTGGGMGLGEALCQALSRQGAVVVVADINGNAAQEVACRIEQGAARAHAIQVDVSNREGMESLIETTVSRFGRIDYFFNNAAIFIGGDARDLSVDQWERMLSVNLHGVVYGTVYAYQLMVKQGHGHIVNIASISGLLPQPGNTPYTTCKHGIVGLSLGLRVEGADLGVKVSAACPGDMKTKIFENMVVVNMSRERVIELSQRSSFLLPEISAENAAHTILRGVARNRALIVFPATIRLIWRLYRACPILVYWSNRQVMRVIRKLRINP
jgi:NAD(P)-dependent dehydrogenase (short-subunit alcohol dehydrogenase family)